MNGWAIPGAYLFCLYVCDRNELTTSHTVDPPTRLGCLRCYRNLREITFQLTNVIPERIIFVSRGITVHMYVCMYVCMYVRTYV